MQAPSDEVAAEFRDLLQANQKRLGQVYRLMERGWTNDRIAQELGVKSSNFVSNNRVIVRAILEGREPTGPAMANQVASAVRGLVRGTQLSPAATAHVQHVVDAMDSLQGERSRASASHREVTVPAAPLDVPSHQVSLRDATHRAVRDRAEMLLGRITGETGMDPTDYHRILVAPFAPDAVYRLIIPNATSATSRALDRAGRVDLTLESAVLLWAGDIPFGEDVIEAARARVDWWSRQ